jgi:lambda family phage portal protein
VIQTISNTIRRALKSVQGGLRLSAEAAHQGASLTSRELASWLPAQGSADADLLPDLPTLVSRSRDLIRNHGIASGAMQTLVDNVCGAGLRLSSTPDYRALGRDKDWAEEWSQRVESLWRSWADTIECDAANSLTFSGLTAQVFRSALLNGESLALPLWVPNPTARFGTRVQVIEADRLSNPNLRIDTANLRGGVEIDSNGAPVAYWIRKSHPGDALIGGALFDAEWERVPAFTPWGRRRVIHVHDKERTGQTRGKPMLSSVLLTRRFFSSRKDFHAAIGVSWRTVDRSAVRMAVMVLRPVRVS